MEEFDADEASAGAVVMSGTGRSASIALLRRHGADEWVIPKGHLERGESWEGAAIREIEEELGIPADQLVVRFELDTYIEGEAAQRFGRRKKVRLFLGTVDGDATALVPDSAHADARWWPISEPLPRLAHTEQAGVLRRLISTALELDDGP